MGGTVGASGELIKVVVKNFDVLAGPMISLVYPLYASIKEIENKSTNNNDQQWLTYWILYSMITLFELSFAKFIVWIPIWSYVKFFLTCWLVMPYFNGAALVYHHYVKPTFAYRGQGFDVTSRIPRWKKGIFGNRKPDDILTAVEKYIKENGTEGLEKLIHRVDRNTHYGDLCYTGYSEDNTWNTAGYDDNTCYTNYNENETWNTGYGDMYCHADYNENETWNSYDNTNYTDYNSEEYYTYRSFGD